jgi:ABC-type transport system involved in multi-copper enzyme maturation permease subunit
MPIREKGYYNWEGELKTSPVKWLPIFLNGIKTVYKKKWSKLVFAFCGFTFLVFLAAVYVATKPELKMLSRMVKEIQTDALLFNAYYTNGFLLFMMLMLCIFAGGDLVSGDLKFKSFTLYLSRPLKRLDYVKGKFSIIFFYLLVFTLGLGLLLVLFKIIFSGEFSVPFHVFLAAIGFPIVMATFLASFTIMFSSLSPSSRLVRVLIFVAYLMSNAFGYSLRAIFRQRAFLHLSIEHNVREFGKFIFGTTGRGFYTEGFIAGCILAALALIFLFIVIIRIKRVEV